MIRNAFITLFALVLTAGQAGLTTGGTTTIVAAQADTAGSVQVA